MPPQSRAAQGFAGVAVEIDLIHKGIKTRFHGCRFQFPLAQKWK